MSKGSISTDSDSYVHRWFLWLHGGLRGRVNCRGRFTRIWITVLKHLNITGYAVDSRYQPLAASGSAPLPIVAA